MKKHRRSRRKFKIRRVPNNLRTLTLNLEWEFPVTISGQPAGITNTNYNLALNFPGQFVSFNTTWGSLANPPATYTRLMTTGFFDQYKVNFLSVRFLPNSVNTLVNTSFGDASDTPNLVYRFNDLDDIVDDPSEPQMLGAGILPKQYANGQAVSFRFSQIKRMRGRFINTGLATQSPTTTTVGQTTLPENAYASMKIFFPNLNHGTAPVFYGRIYATWNVTYKGVNSTVVP